MSVNMVLLHFLGIQFIVICVHVIVGVTENFFTRMYGKFFESSIIDLY